MFKQIVMSIPCLLMMNLAFSETKNEKENKAFINGSNNAVTTTQNRNQSARYSFLSGINLSAPQQVTPTKYLKSSALLKDSKAKEKFWTSGKESSALQEILVLSKSEKLSIPTESLISAFFQFQSKIYIKPSVVLDAVNKWSDKDKKAFTLFILKAKKVQLSFNDKGGNLSADEAFEKIVKEEEQFCLACGCKV